MDSICQNCCKKKRLNIYIDMWNLHDQVLASRRGKNGPSGISIVWNNYALLICNVSCACSALGTWFFSVAGALVAIPVGIKKKSLAPLVFFGTTGTMLDIIMGISQCEREHAERQMKLLEAQNLSANASADGENWSSSLIIRTSKMQLLFFVTY